jgi:hypothetical protein
MGLAREKVTQILKNLCNKFFGMGDSMIDNNKLTKYQLYIDKQLGMCNYIIVQCEEAR